MKKINNKEFEKLIDVFGYNDVLVSEYEIELDKEISIDLSKKSYTFKNCIFLGARIDFYDFERNNDFKNEYQSLSFSNCTIKNNLFIKECTLYSVEFDNVDVLSEQFFIAYSDINRITITGSSDKKNLIKSIHLDNLNFKESHLDIRLNEIQESFVISNSYFKTTTINVNIINRVNIYESEFGQSFQFWRNKLNLYSSIDNNTFNDFEAKDSDLGKETHFNKIKFTGNCNLENLKNPLGRLKFTKCNFDKYVYFDKSELYEFSFDTAFFKEIVSFQNIKCNYIKFNRTHFDKVSFFNDAVIQKINSCDLKTIRLIKNHLLKTENKIDYLKYNALEQNNLLSSSELTLNDRILLKLNKKSNDFGNNWINGVLFTFKKGMLFFILLLIVNSFISSKYPLSLNLSGTIASVSEILTEFLKFVFSFGFDNKEIQSNGFLYLIFIIAKIYIGYGVYQTISAFRKYGKN
ncbi:hypothetical protein V3468_04980 [Flavobacterium oreochromis]|uniref:hypothetical protein n=1 Tax=Flavobacterium oreochromis TaxID=2906078 RepID=UPI003857FD12